ncbi:cell wall hydrolase [Paenibacillus chitinolyticus]|uniref:cell wall hydrolase n=1 Tax=Paenibacillus chitinolyticus TaxID=79263 RepID=UPI003D055919
MNLKFFISIMTIICGIAIWPQELPSDNNAKPLPAPKWAIKYVPRLDHHKATIQIQQATTPALKDEQGTENEMTPQKQSQPYSDEDIYWLARIVSAEAKGESEIGQIAVANVVLNRVKSEKFPDTIKKVIFAKGQFSPVNNKSIFKEPTTKATESARKALQGKKVINEDVYYFFEARTATSKWSKTRKVAAVIGNHTFTY